MSHLRFHHVYLGLLLISGTCAFAVPPRYAHLLRGRVDGLFAPVASPVRHLAGIVARRFGSSGEAAGIDVPSSPEEAGQEIADLRKAVASLTLQVAELRQLSASRELAGDVDKYAIPLKVIGGDGGSRETLALASSAADGVSAGMPVVHRDGLVGRVINAGAGGSQVRLITDRGFRVTGAFGRFVRAKSGRVEFVPSSTPPPLVEGRGGGLMGIANLTMKQLEEAGVRAGDWVVLRDPDWPMMMNGYLLGCVERIEAQRRAPLFAEVTVKPRASLRQLREAMVVTGRPR